MRAISERSFVERCLGVALAALAACSGGSSGGHETPPPDPEPESTVLTRFDDAPKVRLEIIALSGASGEDGTFRTGDRVTARFRVLKADGSRWGLPEMVASSALVSGPTFNYQRVLAERGDVVDRAFANADGSYTYVFADGLPRQYLAPFNDTASFGPEEGELAGQPLLAGTYTVGMSLVWSYSVEGVTYHQVGEATADFRFGGSATLQPREVTRTDNCNACHVSLRAHESKRRSTAMCVLCHTAGAEDLNDPAIAGGTPGRTIEMKVMVHKIHNGRHLPSVLGIGVDAAGNVVYDVPPQPYVLVDGATGAHDYSDVGFPAFPSRTSPLPRDFGYSSLTPANRALDDRVRSGVTRCDACHGDPDGAGPLGAPAQGDLIRAQPTRRACGACHDDVDFGRDYVVNQQIMPPQDDDASCFQCHGPDGLGFYSPLAILDGHLHPLHDPVYTGTTFPDFTSFAGLELGLVSVAEAGASDGDGTLDPGEKVAVQVTLRTASGANFPLPKLGGLEAVLSGPSWNSNLVHQVAIPRSQLAGSQPYTVLLPERIQLELVGRSTAAPGDVFVTARAPHLASTGAQTVVRVRSGTSGGSSVLASTLRAPANVLDVADGGGFARDDFVVIDDGGQREEYARLQHVEGNRLWLSSPSTPAYKASTGFDHAAGASVREVQLDVLPPNTYSLDAQTGTITELVEIGAGVALVVDSTTHFVVPDDHGLAANHSPDLDETSGRWTGKPLADGTYRVTLSAWTDLVLNANAEDSPYRYAAPAVALDVLVGSANSPEPYAAIESGSACSACHAELRYHDSYLGFDSCIACHGNAGAEDRPRYVAANAPDTPGVTTSFRSLVHAIHRGRELANASTFTVVGAGTAAHPDNFTLNRFDDVHFPAQPRRTANCAKCHGAANEAWKAPPPRDHPTDQGSPVLVWQATCGACHDSAAAAAHIGLKTNAGVESCDVCHGDEDFDGVEVVHRVR